MEPNGSAPRARLDINNMENAMYLKRTFRAGLSALALAALAACQTGTPDKQVLSTGESYQSPADVHFLYDDEGNVARHLPVEILKSVKADLLAQGQNALAKDLEALYDFETGEVKDARSAEMAEGYLKSQLPRIQPVQAAPVAQTAQAIRPEDLPAGITLPQELIEGLRKSAVNGDAK